MKTFYEYCFDYQMLNILYSSKIIEEDFVCRFKNMKW